MKKLIMCKGLPASGKDTWAKKEMADHPNLYKRVNKDDIRTLLDFGVWSRDNEKFVVKERDILIEDALKEGYSVICSDTNLSPKHEIRLQQLAMIHDAAFEIKDFTDVPLEECIRRDELRLVRVGSKVIMGMYDQFMRKPAPAPVYDPTLPICVVSDIDGTLALFGEQNPYERDFIKDDVSRPVMGILKRYARDATIILVSGRNGKFRRQTEEWLNAKSILYNELYMREEADRRDDVTVKREMYEAHIKGKYNVLFVIDDRPKVVRFWRQELGLFVFEVNQLGMEF